MAKFQVILRLLEEKIYGFQIEEQDIDSAGDQATRMIEGLNNGTYPVSKDWEEGLESFEWELEDLDEL